MCFDYREWSEEEHVPPPGKGETWKTGLRRRCGRSQAGLGMLIVLVAVLAAPLPGSEASRVLRVAADPNNLPFSNERREGFENKLAELIARDLGAQLEYVWWPQRRGFFRETIGAGRADLVLGVPAGFERVLSTQPYYRSSYVFVTRPGLAVRSLDDPALAKLTIGVQMIGDDFNNAPPAHALSRRGMIDNVRGFSLYGDYAQESPPSEIVKAVARGEIDVAVAWGPMAGFFAQRQTVPLDVVPVSPERDGPALPFTFEIAMGVQRGNSKLKAEVDNVLERRRGEIADILAQYHVPLLPMIPSRETDHAVAK